MRTIEIIADTTNPATLEISFLNPLSHPLVCLYLRKEEIIDQYSKLFLEVHRLGIITICESDILSNLLEENTKLSKFLVNAKRDYNIDVCQCGGIVNLSNSQQAESHQCYSCLTDAVNVSRPAEIDPTTP